MDFSSIDIICPGCNGKAEFLSKGEVTISTIRRPSEKGKIICSKCGLIKDSIFNQTMYYYQIPVASRYLYARNRENLLALRKYFDEYSKTDDPDMDFPGEFYENRVTLIKSIDKRLERELKAR